MNINRYLSTLLPVIALTCGMHANESAPQEIAASELSEDVTPDVGVISEAFGHLIAKNLESLGFDFDMARVVKGIQDSSLGKEAPLSEAECVQAISAKQESKFQETAKVNLQLADDFMKTNAHEKGVVQLEEGKLHYKVEKEGSGEIVEPHFSPVIRYTGKFIDGQIFGSSREDELISLDETIQGFSRGIVGMKEGEKRTLYIHPTLGYGTQGHYLPPNSLLTFEIELVKANAPKKEEEALSDHLDGLEDDEAEVALPSDSSPALSR